MNEKSVKNKEKVNVNPVSTEDNKKVVNDARKSTKETDTDARKKSLAELIAGWNNDPNYVPGRMPKNKYKKVQSRRRMQKKSRKNNRR